MDIDSGSRRSNHDTIVKFGRYPQRNQALGRLSTKKEQKFIDKLAMRTSSDG